MSLGYHVISGERLLELLRRAHDGENPDLVYAEEYVNAEREQVARQRLREAAEDA